MKEIVKSQKELYKSGLTMSENFRRLQLEKLREGILEHQGEICQALRKDLNKSEFETYEMCIRDRSHRREAYPSTASIIFQIFIDRNPGGAKG